MQYFVSSADQRLGERVRTELREAGFDVLEAYRDGAVIVSLGGDGSILYNARTYGEATILPVATGDSEANKIQLEPGELVERIRRLEDGRPGEDYHLATHRKLVATVDGAEVRGEFGALNDVQLHHASPVRAAEFRVRIAEGDRTVLEVEKAIGDGLVVATPFGSTAYFRSIAGGRFEEGIGVAFNNLHVPVDAPAFVVLPGDARVVVETLPETHGDGGVLVRDDDSDPYRPEPGTPVEIALSDRAVEIVRFPG